MRVPRHNPDLNDQIEVLQEHFLNCGQDISRAWAELPSGGLTFIETEIDKAMDLRYYLENYHVIKTEHGQQKTLYPFWDHQEILYEAIQEEWAENGYCRIIVLKPRQTGISVWTAASMLHRTMFTPHCFTMIVAQNDDTSEYIYQMSLNAYANLPWWLKPEWMYKTKNGGIEFQRRDDKERQVDPGLGSGLQVSAATKTTGVAIGRSIRALHACLTGNNEVIDARGYHKPISSVVVGDFVRVPGGNGKVTAVSSRSASSVYPGGENGYRITPWCGSGFPIEGTGNHKIKCVQLQDKHKAEHRSFIKGLDNLHNSHVTERGMVELRDLTKDDWLVYPVRPITYEGAPEDASFPIHLNRAPLNRPGGVFSDWTPPEFDKEFGYAIGLFLAEGNIHSKGKVLNIALHTSEAQLAARFSKAIGIPHGKPSSSGENGTAFNFSSVALCSWFKEWIGAGDRRHIPSWAWQCGSDFLSGIVEGMIEGDGSLTKTAHVCQFFTTRAHLAVEIRDAVASLGWGWGGVQRREAGIKHDRNCKESFVVGWGKYTNDILRKEFGWEVANKGSIKTRSHWRYSEDKTAIYAGVRLIERVMLSEVYDIEVDTPDHEFLLSCALTHNSEVSRWPNDEVYEADIRPSMNARDTYQIFESTGYGRQGLFYDEWSAAVDGESDMRAVWIPVYKVKKYYTLPENMPETFELADDERAFNERVEKEEHFAIPDTFWDFRRNRMRAAKRKGKKAGFLESYPLSPQEAFQSSGLCAFDRDSLEWQQMNKVCEPKFAGEITLISMEPPRVNTDDIMPVNDKHDLPRRKSGRGGKRMFIWEMPEGNETYYVSADVALGNGGDYSMATVWRAGQGMEPDSVVATWWGWIPPKKFAHVIAAIGIFYNSSEVAVEYMKDGITTGNELRDMDYPNLYRPQWKDKITNQASNYLHFVTNSKTRDEIIGCMNEALLDHTAIIRDAEMLDEMIDFASMETDGRSEGQGNNDDSVISAMIGLYCLRETTKHLKTSASTEKVRDTGELHVYGVYDNIMRQRGQYNTQAEAEKMIAGKAGWSVRPILVCQANTLYSPIWDAMGAERDLHLRHGMHSTEITPDLVWAYKSAMRNYDPAGGDYGDNW